MYPEPTFEFRLSIYCFPKKKIQNLMMKNTHIKIIIKIIICISTDYELNWIGSVSMRKGNNMCFQKKKNQNLMMKNTGLKKNNMYFD